MNALGTLGIDKALCTGCAACEVACSFHFQRRFGPAGSAIAVYRDDRDGTVRISLSDECDLCSDDKDGPLCVKYCAPGALSLDGGAHDG
jgi:Fe-S-cluster-containing dehydrogenase component